MYIYVCVCVCMCVWDTISQLRSESPQKENDIGISPDQIYLSKWHKNISK